MGEERVDADHRSEEGEKDYDWRKQLGQRRHVGETVVVYLFLERRGGAEGVGSA